METWKKVKADMTRQYFSELMKQTKGNISEASRISGLYRADIYGVLDKLDIPCRKYRNKPIVYFLKADNGLIKIGKTYDVEKRIKSLSTSHANDLILLATTTKHREEELHSRFKQFRVRREWFTPVSELLEFIQSLESDAVYMSTQSRRSV